MLEAARAFLLGRKSAHIASLLAIVGIVYANSLPAGFALDDFVLLVDNTAVHGLGLENLKRVFTSSPNMMEYLPVRDLTYMADYSVWGLRPFGYHLSNVVYYALCSAVLYLFLLRLLQGRVEGAPAVAFVSTVLFVVHPVHVEAVAGISQRKDLLSAAFLWLSLLCYMSFREKGTVRIYSASLLFALLALLSKGAAVALPALVFLVDLYYGERAGRRLWPAALRAAPFLLITALATAVNFYVMSGFGSIREAEVVAPSAQAYTILVAAFRYLWMLTYPHPLSIWHPADYYKEIAKAPVLLSALGTAAFLTAAFGLWKRQATVSFSMFWFLAAIAPAFWVLPKNFILAERYLFVPSLAVCLVAGLFLKKRVFSGSKRVGYVGVAAFLSASVVFAAMSAEHNRAWKDNEALYGSALEHDPWALGLNAMMGQIYFTQGRYDEAFVYFERTRQIAPYAPDYEFYRALLKYKRGEYDEALYVLDGLYQSTGIDYISMHYLYGLLYEEKGLPDKAKKSYIRALGSRMTLFAEPFTKAHARQGLARLSGR